MTGYTSPIAIHPRHTIKEAMVYAGVNRLAIAEKANISLYKLDKVLNKNGHISTELINVFSEMLGLSATILHNMQNGYYKDLARLSKKQNEKI